MQEFKNHALDMMIGIFLQVAEIKPKTPAEAKHQQLSLVHIAAKIREYARQNGIRRRAILENKSLHKCEFIWVLDNAFDTRSRTRTKEQRMFSALYELKGLTGLRGNLMDAIKNLSGSDADKFVLEAKGLSYKDVFIQAASSAINNVHLFGPDAQQVYLAGKYDELVGMTEEQIKNFLETTPLLGFLKYNTAVRIANMRENMLEAFKEEQVKYNREWRTHMRRIKRLARKKQNQADYEKVGTYYPEIKKLVDDALAKKREINANQNNR